MEQQFIDKNFTEASLKVIRMANRVCFEYGEEGYDLSLRQLYYQFIARNLLENTESSYKRLGKIVSDARLAGVLDWEYIKDRGRKHERPPHWDSPQEILDVCAKQFRVDRWEGQKNYVLVMVEKQALEGVLLPLCEKLDVGFVANKGYSSSSMMYELGEKIYNARSDHTVSKQAHVIYLGDHDPSGLDMSRDVTDRLELFSEGNVFVHRVALNMDQIEEFAPPENPTKLTDSRAAAYVAEFGYSSWELDALEPKILTSLVQAKVSSLCDAPLFEERVRQENQWKEEISYMAAEYSM